MVKSYAEAFKESTIWLNDRSSANQLNYNCMKLNIIKELKAFFSLPVAIRIQL